MRIAITGGIGAGKSFVCRRLETFGIRIYDCDAGAKRLMRESEELKQRLTALVGSDTYVNGALNKAAVSRFLLASEENKQAINAIVHPAVIADFYASGMVWMESAILYEAHLEDKVDRVVCVVAPVDIRVERIMQRDGITAEQARQWIRTQLPQEESARRADFTILNDGEADLDAQIRAILNEIDK